jgi:CO dehydrogenase maturation factor
MIADDGLELAGIIPQDDAVYEYDLKGKPTIGIAEESPSVKAAFSIFDRILGQQA